MHTFLKSPFFQLFAVLFFLMMATLGIGSGVALVSVINSVLLDAFPRVPTYLMSGGVCSSIFLMGLVYVTPVSKNYNPFALPMTSPSTRNRLVKDAHGSG